MNEKHSKMEEIGNFDTSKKNTTSGSNSEVFSQNRVHDNLPLQVLKLTRRQVSWNWNPKPAASFRADIRERKRGGFLDTFHSRGKSAEFVKRDFSEKKVYWMGPVLGKGKHPHVKLLPSFLFSNNVISIPDFDSFVPYYKKVHSWQVYRCYLSIQHGIHVHPEHLKITSKKKSDA